MKKRKILVVDDEINVCKSICQALVSEESEIDMALSGEEAVQMDESNEYELIITDLMMPGLSGMDLLNSIKTKRPDTQVIMITGYPTIKTAVEAVKKGAFDYIPKPFTPSDLRSAVARAFRQKEKLIHFDEGEAGESRVPPGYHVMIGHTWLKEGADSLVYVGVVHEFLRSIGGIESIDFPRNHSQIVQGDACVAMTDKRGLSHRVWSPVSGRVVKINPVLSGDYSTLLSDPYGQGWLFAVEPACLS